MKRNSFWMAYTLIGAAVCALLLFLWWSWIKGQLPDEREWHAVFPAVTDKLNKSYGMANINKEGVDQVNTRLDDLLDGIRVQLSNEVEEVGYVRDHKVAKRSLVNVHFKHDNTLYLLGVYRYEKDLLPKLTEFSTDTRSYKVMKANATSRVLPVAVQELSEVIPNHTIILVNEVKPYYIYVLARGTPKTLAQNIDKLVTF